MDEYPKLVRDNIPAIIKDNQGIDVEIRSLTDDAEYEKYLRQKFTEEAAELAAAETDEQTIEEVADLEELIEALLVLKGIERSAVAKVQIEKRGKRGGFTDRLLMIKAAENNIEDKGDQ